MKGVEACSVFVKKMRDMSGLLPRFITELAITWVLDEILLVYEPSSDDMVEFNAIYGDMRLKPKGRDVADLTWSENSTPLYFVARAGIDLCIALSLELSRGGDEKEVMAVKAKLLVRTARFVQMCSQTALGLSYSLESNKVRDCRRFSDLYKEAESLALISSSYSS